MTLRQKLFVLIAASVGYFVAMEFWAGVPLKLSAYIFFAVVIPVAAFRIVLPPLLSRLFGK